MSARFWMLVAAAAIYGCKESDKQRVVEAEEAPLEEGAVRARRSGEVGFYATDADYLKKNADFFFKIWDESFTLRFDDLPTAGAVPTEKQPMSGYWYPEPLGGTNVRVSGNRTPLQKFDDAFNGGQPLAANWEREKHSSQVSWAGHCNGFSAAGQRHPEEPSRNVERNGVVFTPHDIKALLAEIHMSADYEFLGGNRCESRAVRSPLARENPAEMDECEDINPGTLHATIANWIGRMKHTLIVDYFTGDEVWNYPLISYEVLDVQRNLTAEQARQLVAGGSGAYIFNPNATRFVRLRTRLTYVSSLNQEALGQRQLGYFNLDYILELNAKGEILGGEWIGQSQGNHPDFLWVALPPMEPNGTRYMHNPHVDIDEVIKLWAESTGHDPENPPLDIARPEILDDWGRWAGFDVTLDGGRRGTVFGGKPTVVRIERRDPLNDADVSLDLILNGTKLTTLSGAQGKPFVYSFDSHPGLNRFQFVWKRGGEVLEEEALRFHALP